MVRRCRVWLAILLAILPALTQAGDAPPADAGELAARLDTESPITEVAGTRLIDPDAVARFYRERGFQPAWTGASCTAARIALHGAIESVASHGLDPDDYHRAVLADPATCAPDRELIATDAWLMMAAHLHGGRIDPRTVEPDWSATRPGIDLVARLAQALAAGEVAQSLDALAPRDAHYAALREALARWRDLAAGTPWPMLDPGPSLRAGDQGPQVAQLRARLLAEGLIGQVDAAAGDEIFDELLDEAVRAFQRAANLEPDGVVGAATRVELAHTPAFRVEQLRANLERLRWLPDDEQGRQIRVNIANFRLEAHAGDRIERVHRVIVGRDVRRTPSFSADLRYIVLNPWWEVPRRLATQDKLPVFSRDPAQVDRLGFTLLDAWGRVVDHGGIDWAALSRRHFPYRLRQRPGPLNALGQVKLILPNGHDVYLHDTPQRGLFARTRRDFSSGCIRVDGALDLAEWALDGVPGWDRARIDAAVASGAETRVDLGTPIAVHLQYLTAVVQDGTVRFLADLYDRDAALVAALDAPPPQRRPAVAAAR